jgi:pteridine reductase
MVTGRHWLAPYQASRTSRPSRSFILSTGITPVNASANQNETPTTGPLVALITGSGRRRLGNHIARGLAADGYHIAVHYRSSQDEAQQLVQDLQQEGVESAAFQADLAKGPQIRQMMDDVLKKFGRLDALINTASVWQAIPLEKITEQDLQNQFDVDLKGTFLCSQMAGLQMVQQETGGAIVNFGDWAVERPYPDHAAYFAVKGAIPVLTRALARELGQRNPRIRVNCILPGPVLVPPDADDEERKTLLDSTLVRQVDRPDSIVNAVRYLIRETFVTGVCLPVDGGRTIFAANESR